MSYFLSVAGNLPVVPEEKYEKLMGVLRKIFSQIGTIKEGEFLDAVLRPASSIRTRFNTTCMF